MTYFWVQDLSRRWRRSSSSCSVWTAGSRDPATGSRGEVSLIRGAAPGDVVDGAGRKAEIGRAEKRDQRGDFLRFADSPHRDAAGHVGDVLVADLGQDRGLDYSRRHGIDQHTFGGNLFSDCFRQADHPGFCGRIRDRVRIAFLARDRGDIDDAAKAGVDHDGDDGFAAQEDAGEVDIHNLLPLVYTQLPDWGRASGDAGVVDQGVDAPPAV